RAKPLLPQGREGVGTLQPGREIALTRAGQALVGVDAHVVGAALNARYDLDALAARAALLVHRPTVGVENLHHRVDVLAHVYVQREGAVVANVDAIPVVDRRGIVRRVAHEGLHRPTLLE